MFVGKPQALTQYRKALGLLPQDSEERRQLLDWYALASEKKPLVLNIAPIKTRQVPQELEAHRADMDMAAKCFGRARAGIDFEMATRGTWLDKHGSLAGKSFDSSTKFLVIDAGLSIVESSLSDLSDFSRRSVTVSSPMGMWMQSRGRWISGTLAGATQDSDWSSSAIECPTPLLPLTEGKMFTLQRVDTHINRNIGNSGNSFLTGTDTTTNTVSMTFKVISPSMSAADALARFPYLRFTGPSAPRWRVSEMEFSYSSNMRTVSKDGKVTNNSSSSTSKGVFVEGPNTFVGTQDENLRPGWTTTISEIP